MIEARDRYAQPRRRSGWPPEAIEREGMSVSTRILHEDLVRLAEGMIKIALANQQRETHEALIRLGKGVIIAWEKWLEKS